MPANHKIKPQQKIVNNEEWSFMANIKKEKNWMQIYLKKKFKKNIYLKHWRPVIDWV